MDTSLKIVPLGAVGEIYTSGRGVGSGYIGNDEQTIQLTKQKFIQNPIGNDILFATGDQGCITYDPFLGKGNLILRYLGRLNKRVKIHGISLELGQVEAVLENHELVGQAVCDLCNDKGGEILVAFVVLKRQSLQDLNEKLGGLDIKTLLRRYCRMQLQHHQAPDIIEIFTELPKTSTFKVDRQKLIHQFNEKVKHIHINRSKPQRQTLTDKTQCIVHQFIMDLLGTRIEEDVKLDDDFDDLGGRSLQFLALLNKIRQYFNVNTDSLIQLHKSGQCTIRNLALKIEKAITSKEESNSIVELAIGSQNGKGGGDCSSLFLIHPGSGSLLGYSNLAVELIKENPRLAVFGIQYPEDAKFHNMAELARAYASVISSKLNGEKFFLGGYSFGGPASVAIAQELKKEGKIVHKVICIDEPPIQLIEFDTSPNAVARFICSQLLAMHNINPKNDSFHDKNSVEEIASSLQEIVQKMVGSGANVSIEILESAIVTLQHLISIESTFAAEKDKSLNMLVLATKEDFPVRFGGRRDIWDDYANHVDFAFVPGTHITCFKPDYIPNLVHIIGKALL